MAAGDISITISEDLSAALDRAQDAAVDLTQPMRRIAVRGVSQTKLRFREHRAPDGVPWKPSKRVERYGGQTLVLNGYLFGSMREDWGRDFAAFGPENSGPSARYARIHQEGGPITPRGQGGGAHFAARAFLPARRYLGWTRADDEFALGALGNHLMAAFTAGGAFPAGAA